MAAGLCKVCLGEAAVVNIAEGIVPGQILYYVL